MLQVMRELFEQDENSTLQDVLHFALCISYVLQSANQLLELDGALVELGMFWYSLSNAGDLPFIPKE